MDALYCAIRLLDPVKPLGGKIALAPGGWEQPGFGYLQAAFPCAFRIAVFDKPNIPPVDRGREFDDPVLAVYAGQNLRPGAAGRSA